MISFNVPAVLRQKFCCSLRLCRVLHSPPFLSGMPLPVASVQPCGHRDCTRLSALLVSASFLPTLIRLEFPLAFLLPHFGDDGWLPQLLCSLPATNAILNHTAGLAKYRALRYFARLPTCLPNLVRLRYVLDTSYHFLRTLPLASNALVIRIIFPLVRVIPASFSRPGLPASLGKQKGAKWRPFLVCR